MDDTALVRLARQGDEDSLERLYEIHRERVFRLACLYSRSPEDAEDILHETFIKAFLRIRFFRERPGASFGAWLNRICVNHARDVSRKQSREKIDRRFSPEDCNGRLASGDMSPVKSAELEQASRFIQDALQKLTAKQRLVFDLKYIQHWRLEEIAALSRCGVSNIKNQLCRSRAKLRKHLSGLLEDS